MFSFFTKGNAQYDQLATEFSFKGVEGKSINLADYKEMKRIERLNTIEMLKQNIDSMYSDEKIKEEKLIEYTQGLVQTLKRTSYIALFSQ